MGNCSFFFRGEAGELVSLGFKDQFFGTFKTLLPIGQVCLLSATIAPEMLGLTTKCLRVVVLFPVEKAEPTLEGIRQFYVATEKEEWKLGTLCDRFETRRVDSLGIPPVCLSRFGLRVHARCLGMDAQGTLEFLV